MNGGYDNRAKGRNTGYGSRNPCQICGKTNHTAQRQNINFQPPSFVNIGSERSTSQSWNGMSQNGYGGYSGLDRVATRYNNSQNYFYGMPTSPCMPGSFPLASYGNAHGMSGMVFPGYLGNSQGMSSMGYNGGFGVQSFTYPPNQFSQFARAGRSQSETSSFP